MGQAHSQHPQSINISLDKQSAAHPLAHIQFNTSDLTLNQFIHVGSGITQVNKPQIAECLLSSQPSTAGHSDNLYWSMTDDYLFLAKTCKLDSATNFSRYIESSYTTLLTHLQQQGYKHIAKIWNYIPQINAGEGDNEVYKIFTQARFKAFKKLGFSDDDFPAASALGYSGDAMIIYLLASKKKTVHFENPNQTKAYEYPRKYGPKSPSFARATLLEGSPNSTLFISGTASILGSESMHTDCVEQQTLQASKNVSTLLQHIAQEIKINTQITPATIKVYLRNINDYQKTKEVLDNYWQDSNIAFIYTVADICRRELSVEIEAICELQHYP